MLWWQARPHGTCAPPPVAHLYSLVRSYTTSGTRSRFTGCVVLSTPNRRSSPVMLRHLLWRRNEFESGDRNTDPARSAEGKIFLVVPLHFLALKVQLVVLAGPFVIVSTVKSVSCLLFFYSRCPPCPVICKSGGTCPHAPWSQRHRSLADYSLSYS